MKICQLTIQNPSGLHMRPANLFVKKMGGFDSSITLRHGGKEYNAKSMIDIMTACVKQGANVELVASGKDEEQVIATAQELVGLNLGEN